MDSKEIYRRAVVLVRHSIPADRNHVEGLFKTLFWNEPGFSQEAFHQACCCTTDELDMRMNELCRGV